MNINPTTNFSNTNFKGAFRVANVTPQIKQEFQRLTADGCKVAYDFSKKGDAFLVAHDRLNREIKGFLQKICGKSFSFYGNITPANFKGFDRIKKMLQYSELPPANNRVFSKWDSLYHELRDLKDIGFEVDTDKATLSMYKGVALIDDVANERKILLSPRVENMTYAKIYPYSKEKSAEYVMYKSKHWTDIPAMVYKRYTTPDEIMEFNKLFNDAKRNYNPDFMKGCPEGRTNFELLVEKVCNPEEFFARIMKENPELAKLFCYEPTFVPVSMAVHPLVDSETVEDGVKTFSNYLKRTHK